CRTRPRSSDIVQARMSLRRHRGPIVMDYMLLLYADPRGFETMSPSQAQEMVAAYTAYTGALQEAGVLRGANRLRPGPSASTVRLSSGKTEVLDGPYAETREEL